MEHQPTPADFVLATVFGLIGLVIYFLPTFIGMSKRNGCAIFVLNLLLGWSFVGWVAALVWSLTKDYPEQDPR
jgi:hypothetical protein